MFIHFKIQPFLMQKAKRAASDLFKTLVLSALNIENTFLSNHILETLSRLANEAREARMQVVNKVPSSPKAG